MNTTPESDFDLEKLFLPAWAQESANVNRYAKHSGEDRPERRSDGRSGGPRGPRRDGPRPAGGGPNRGPQGQGGDRRGPRRDGDRPQRFGDRRGGPQGDRRDHRGPERREPAALLPDLIVTLMPDEKGVDSIARQIKMSGRSFPLFDIAHMILQKPERQQVRFEIKKNAEGQPIQPLFLCAIDDTLWLSEAEAVEHVLTKHFATFYQTEKTPTDPPKGTYTFVAQCGMSGVILGPPNYHDYQNQLRKLHTERFSRMPFDAFKSRVKIVKEEAVVKKWIEDQSFKTEYVCLNVPEASRLGSRELVEKHFREIHLPNIVKQVEKHTMSGPASRQLRSPGLQRLLRIAWEDQRKFPIQVATVLSQQFAARGLQFFKVNKTFTHVSVARPHFLDLEATPVSAQVKSIVDFINATPKCTRRRLVEALAPTPKAVAPVAPAPVEGAAPATEGSAPPAAPAEAAPTPEQASIIGDLHWLIHQGHVIEFATGILETAKRPIIKPPKPAKPAAEAKPAGETAAAAATGEQSSVAEVAGIAETAPTPESPAPLAEAAAPTEIASPEPVAAVEPVSTPPSETPAA